MRKLIVAVCTLCIVALLAGGASAFDIRVAPSTLVLSSTAGKLTVHADVPFDKEFHTIGMVVLTVAGTDVPVTLVKPDLCGNLVVQCDKESVVIPPFDGKSAEFDVVLEAFDPVVDSLDTGTGSIVVKKGKSR